MHKFYITVGHLTETFRSESDYGPGETREHWTLAGLEKLIRLGLWHRELDKRGNVKVKPPTVEMMRRLGQRQVSSDADG